MHVLKMVSDERRYTGKKYYHFIVVPFNGSTTYTAEKTGSLWLCTGFINLFTVCMCFVAEVSCHIAF